MPEVVRVPAGEPLEVRLRFQAVAADWHGEPPASVARSRPLDAPPNDRWQAVPGGLSQMAAMLAEVAVQGMRRRCSGTSDLTEALDRTLAELAPLATRSRARVVGDQAEQVGPGEDPHVVVVGGG